MRIKVSIAQRAEPPRSREQVTAAPSGGPAATKESIARALQNKPSVDEVLQKYKAARHPFASGAEG